MSTEIDTEKFGTVPLFTGMNQKEIVSIVKLCENLATKPGEVVVRQGEAGDGIYIIAAGTYEVRKSGASEKALARLAELSFFGEMSLVTDSPRAASVVCVDEGRIKKLPAARFNQLLQASDLTAYKVIHNISKILAQRLARLEEKIVS